MIRHSLPLLILAAVLVHATGLRAQSFEAIAPRATADLRQALDDLADLRRDIADQKIPLSQEVNRLENELQGRRKELEKAQRSRDNQLVDLNVTRTEVKTRREERKYLNDLLNEYLRLFETRIHISEVARYRQMIEDAQAANANADLSAADKFQQQAEVVKTSIDRLNRLLGGDRFDGSALAPNGTYEKGQFALLGPVAYFASGESAATGLATLEFGSPEATVTDLGSERASAIRALVSSGRGALPIDPTDGTALKLQNTEDTLLQHLAKGGPVMVPILISGLVAMFICILKWIQISRIRTAAPQDVHLILSHVRNHDIIKAEGHAKTIAGPIGDMLLTAIEHGREKKEYIEEVMYERMLNTKPQLERYLPIIALAAATAPLLGLLGTVTGMINTFNMITVFGTGDPKMLAGGISEALITTKFGLIVAVPSLLMHAFASRKARGVLANMEESAVSFINGVPEPEEERNKNAGSVYR